MPSAGLFKAAGSSVDPSLAQLFSSSAGPVKAPPKARYDEPPPPAKKRTKHVADEEDDAEDSDEDADENVDADESLSELDDGDESSTADASEDEQQKNLLSLADSAEAKSEPRKRKRRQDEDDLEGKYLQKLAREEEQEQEERAAERRLKRQRLEAQKGAESETKESEDGGEGSDDSDDVMEDVSDSDGDDSAPLDIPQHESLAPSKEALELEKSNRTVFLSNVSTLAITSKSANKELLRHLSSHLEALPQAGTNPTKHKIESLRFRSTAYAGAKLPKKAAFAKKELMAATTKSTNAYVVYTTAVAAREAVKKLNGTVVLDRHLRVDGVAHPSKIDHRRCVFVGNLGFVDDESMIEQDGENARKRSKIPSDVEEGLWRQFSKAGEVESVRVIRDEKTRVGKGFAYVQFKSADAVESALLFNEKKYPPMLPRILRVTRAKAVNKTASAVRSSKPNARTGGQSTGNPNREAIYQPKISSEQQSLQGRASKLFGKAGAARFKKVTKPGKAEQGRIEGIPKRPEDIIFEGHRASAKSGRPKDLKLGRQPGGKKRGAPKTRSSRRGAEWKKKGHRV